jgi:hypothetical protein
MKRLDFCVCEVGMTGPNAKVSQTHGRQTAGVVQGPCATTVGDLVSE